MIDNTAQEPLTGNIYGECAKHPGNNFANCTVCASEIEEAIYAMRRGDLVVVPSDRDELLQLIKDMLPYMQHKEGCDRLSRYSSKWGKVTEWEMRKCTCGLSEFLQRINERSK